jgi:hypothetical protein
MKHGIINDARGRREREDRRKKVLIFMLSG